MSYTEDSLVEQPAIVLFAAIGWQTLSTMNESFDTGGGHTLGRETKGEVIGGAPARRAVRKTKDIGGRHRITNPIPEMRTPQSQKNKNQT